MASKDSIAITRDLAVASIKENAPIISEALGINPPDLDFSYRDKDYQQAQELRVIGKWLETVSDQMPAKPTKKAKATA